MKQNRTLAAIVAVTGLLCASGAAAHGFGEHAHGFAAGIAHPFTGLDHLLAMLAVGLWAAQLDTRAARSVVVAFLVAMAAGSVLAVAGVPLPHVEFGIAASVLVLGLVIAVALRLPLSASVALSAAFALFHGYAHGAELPLMLAPAACAAGFLLATAALIGTGCIAGRMLAIRPVRMAGLCVAVTGVALLATG